MGRPSTSVDHGGRCRRHPKHLQSMGVCPFCLRERLARLSHNHPISSSSGAAYLSSSSSSASSSYSSDSDLSSSASSPPRNMQQHHHDMKRARISFLLRRDRNSSSAAGTLTKSRSMIFDVVGGGRCREEGKGKEKEKEIETTNKKKENFWAKLLMGGSNRHRKKWQKEANLMHSQTIKEKPSAKWILIA